jgi:hypothetical protein
MKEKKQLPASFFYTASIILFCIDLATLYVFERPFTYCLLGFYISALARPMSLIRIIVSCFLLSIAPLISYGRFGLELVYLIPATLLGVKMRLTLYDSTWQYYVLFTVCLLAQIGLLEGKILGLAVSIPYTISVIFVNLVIIAIMSLSLKLYN